MVMDVKKSIKWGVFSLLLTLSPISALAVQNRENFPVEHHFITNPNDPDCRIEFFSLKPQGNGPFPVLFLLHGNQPSENSRGGGQLVDFRYLEKFVGQGIVAVSISIPGFGCSDGERDFSGPFSQKSVAAVIDHFKQLPFVDSQRMGIYGVSKGAVVASMVHKYAPGLSLQILEGGWYDMTSCSPLFPDYMSKIKESITIETGGTLEALVESSAVYHTKQIQSNTLILVGEFDDRRTLPSATALHEKLIEEGKDSRIKVYPNELHALSADKWETIIPFVRENFFHLYGIGINVQLIMPAIQVAKILPDSPAAGKLRVGDVILRISPCNDEHEIDTLRMPISQFLPLILGEKGTSIRLHVQHFDQTYEDVVVERG